MRILVFLTEGFLNLLNNIVQFVNWYNCYNIIVHFFVNWFGRRWNTHAPLKAGKHRTPPLHDKSQYIQNKYKKTHTHTQTYIYIYIYIIYTYTQLLWLAMARPVLSGTCPVKPLYGLGHCAAAQFQGLLIAYTYTKDSYSQIIIFESFQFSTDSQIICLGRDKIHYQESSPTLDSNYYWHTGKMFSGRLADTNGVNSVLCFD